MASEGYIQIKINQLQEKLQNSEDKIDDLFKKIDDKERKIIELSSKIGSELERAEKVIDAKNEFKKSLLSGAENMKSFHEKNYQKQFNRLLKQLNFQLDGIRKIMNETIIDHTTHTIVLQKLLIDKGVITPAEMLYYADRFFEECKELNRIEPIQKTLSISEKSNS